MGSSGSTWKEQRKTGLEILRQMGMGKNVLAEKIQEEITHYIRAIRDHQGAPVDLARMTRVTVSNNICSIVFGKRFEYDDERFTSYVQCIDHNFKLMSGVAILNFLPVLGLLPGDPFKMRDIMANTSSILGFLGEQVEAHHRTLREEGGEEERDVEEDTDFIYSYLRQMQKHRTRGDTDTSLNDDNLRVSVADLFHAGTETTSTAILWTLLFFLHHPHVQDKCFQEIADVIGTHRPPHVRDKPHLPYLEATISEVLRKADVAPLSVLHAPNQDFNFRGFVIPKGATIVPALTCVLQDPEIWGDPENFRPERFIDPDGKHTRPAELIPFSVGAQTQPAVSP